MLFRSIAKAIKTEIMKTTQLTCSAGVSYNKFLAKIGSDLNKPDGLTIITPENAQEILFALPIGKFHGIGKVTAARMQKLGIKNGEDLYRWELKDMLRVFGKAGLFYYNVVRGIDTREVITEFEPKSISCETTFDADTDDMNELFAVLRKLSERLASRMATKGISGQNIVLKLKYDNFEYITRSCAMRGSCNDPAVLYKYGEQLLVANWQSTRKVRLLGLGVGKLDNQDNCEQLSIPL